MEMELIWRVVLITEERRSCLLPSNADNGSCLTERGSEAESPQHKPAPPPFDMRKTNSLSKRQPIQAQLRQAHRSILLPVRAEPTTHARRFRSPSLPPALRIQHAQQQGCELRRC